MTVDHDPDAAEAQGKRIEAIAIDIETAVTAFSDLSASLQGCFGNGEIGQLMEEGHTEVRETALDVYFEASTGYHDAGTDLIGFATQWRQADEDAKNDFGRIHEGTGGK